MLFLTTLLNWNFLIIYIEEESAAKSCEFCFENMQKHLIVSIGKHVLIFFCLFLNLSII